MLRNLFYAIAVWFLVLGAGNLVAPEAVGASYGAKLDATAVTLARYYGAILLPFAYLSWIAATAERSPLKLAIIRASAVGLVLGAIVSILALSSGVVTTTAPTIFVSVLLAILLLGFAYYGFVKTEAA